MDHGRVGPQGVLGGEDGQPNRIRIRFEDGREYHPPHLSKEQGIPVTAGDTIEVTTPGGGGYGDPAEREPALLERDLARGYYAASEIDERFGAIGAVLSGGQEQQVRCCLSGVQPPGDAAGACSSSTSRRSASRIAASVPASAMPAVERRVTISRCLVGSTSARTIFRSASATRQPPGRHCLRLDEDGTGRGSLQQSGRASACSVAVSPGAGLRAR